MVTVILEHKVKDFDRWVDAYKAHDPMRRRFGCTGASVHRNLEDPQDVVIEFKWKSAEAFREFMEKSDVRDVMRAAGVVSEPAVTMLTDPVA